jgi:hypothetical protein
VLKEASTFSVSQLTCTCYTERRKAKEEVRKAL